MLVKKSVVTLFLSFLIFGTVPLVRAQKKTNVTDRKDAKQADQGRTKPSPPVLSSKSSVPAQQGGPSTNQGRAKPSPALSSKSSVLAQQRKVPASTAHRENTIMNRRNE
jgi:hypothetical protein